MLKKIDYYIIKKFLGTFFFTIVLIISISVVFDFSEKIDDFIEKEAPLKAILFDYYLNFIPYYVNLFSFLFTFVSVIFFTSRMASNSEIIAIRSCGVSFPRMLVPYFVSALIIAIFSFLLSNYIIPPANATRLAFENQYIKNRYKNRDRNIHKQVEPGTFVYMESYRNSINLGYKFSMESYEISKIRLGNGDSLKVLGSLRSKLVSDYIKWDTIKNKWVIHNYYIRKYKGRKEVLEQGRKIDTTLRITPEEFSRRLNIVETMNLPQLNAFIKEQKLRGSDTIENYLIEKYKRGAFPFSTFILTLIGVGLASKKMRGGIGMHIGLGILMSFSYIMFMQVSFQFSISGSMSPMLAVWIPNIIFAILSVFVYRWAPK